MCKFSRLADLMSGQVIIVGEGSLPHCVVFVFQMVHQVVLAFEDLLAEVAGVLLVDLHVPGELAALGRGVVTDPTVVGLLASVRPPVDGEVGDVDKYLAAVFTSISPGYHAAFPPHPGLHQGRQGLTVEHQLQSQQSDGELEGETVLLHTDLTSLLFLLLLLVFFLVLLYLLLHLLLHLLLLCDPLQFVPLVSLSPERDPVVLTDVVEEKVRSADLLFTEDTHQAVARLCNKS